MKRILPLLAALALLLALLASLDGEPAEASSALAPRRPTLEVHRTDALGRHFWRPARSEARPPLPRLGGRIWHPESRIAAPRAR